MGCGRSRPIMSSVDGSLFGQDKPIKIGIMFGTNAKSPGKVSTAAGLGAAASISSGGRTMKDYEDQLGALQKENFQLKLRIYFLEEKMGVLGLGTADENAVKKNIELKVEVEALKKELIEKQELLSQAAKAFELHEEQKEISSRNQAQYEQALESERRRISQLESELESYKEKVAESSLFYEETCGITPEIAIGNKEKLQQMEEFVESLEAEVRQLTSSLEDERTWGQELETERDQLRNRIEMESRVKGKVIMEKDADIKSLREKIKTLEGEAFIRESATQQYKSELAEKDRLIKEKISSLEEKCRECNEFNAIADKRKKQVDQLRASLKSRDDALVDSNHKYRTLLNQFENNHRRSSPPCSSPVLDDAQSLTSNPRSLGRLVSPSRVCSDSFDWDITQNISPQRDSKAILDLRKELEERDRELERQDEAKKQLILKLCNVQKTAEKTENELKKLRNEHEKALRMIQELIARQQRSDEKQVRKEQKVSELQQELKKKSTELTPNSKSPQELSNIRDVVKTEFINDCEELLNQQRFEQMEATIDDSQYKIETIKEEKIELGNRIQCDSEVLRHQFCLKEQRIERMVCNHDQTCAELHEKIEKIKQLEEKCALLEEAEGTRVKNLQEITKLSNALLTRDDEIDEQNKKIEQLSKELQVKTQNLQQLVNTELWSKNKEIAKLHNYMTANQSSDKSHNKSELMQECSISQLDMLVIHLDNIGIGVKFNNNVVQLYYVNDGRITDVGISCDSSETLSSHNVELKEKADFFKCLRVIPKLDDAILESNSSTIELKNAKEYCELLRTHIKDLLELLKRMTEDAGYSANIEPKKLALDLFASSKILADDSVQASDGVPLRDYTLEVVCMNEEGRKLIGEQAEIDADKLYQLGTFQSAQSDSETFSEPDRNVSTARIGLQEFQPMSQSRLRRPNHTKTSSDSEDSIDYIPYYKTYQSNINEIDASYQIKILRETNSSMHSELSSLRNELGVLPLSEIISDKFSNMFNKLQKSQIFCEKLQRIFEKKVADGYAMKREKLNNVRKAQLEKKITDVENMAVQIAKQKYQLLQYKENTERKTSQMIVSLNIENESLRLRLRKLEAENELARSTISIFSKDLDRLTLAHSQVLVENTKLTNDKLRMEQEMRKAESRHELDTRTIQEKFEKELTDLNSVNELQKVRMYELETVNKELRRHVVCETSDSAPSSSGISSVLTEKNAKQSCDDIMRDFTSYNGPQYWLPISYPSSSSRSKSTCSPDLGIESDAAISTARPLKDTLKITESMTNLLSDEERCNGEELRGLDCESPLHIEGLDEVHVLKEENEALKRRLMKTRRALEDTFEHLSTSNKNKKNVEKAITKQLMITKSILKKTRIYEEQFGN